MITEQTVNIEARSLAATRGQIKIQSFNARERLERAIKGLGITWSIALACVFIPLLHFILVPLLFLGGIFFGYSQYQVKSLILGGSGICPNCQQNFNIERSKNQWPLEDVCNHCRAFVSIQLP